MNTRSIRFRLVSWYTGWLTVVFAAAGLLLYVALRAHLEKELAAAQFRRARQIAATLLGRVEATGEGHVVNEINAWFTPETNDRFIRLTRGDGSLLYLSQPPTDGSFDPRRAPGLGLVPTAPDWHKARWADGAELLVVVMPTRSAGGRGYVVEVGASLAPAQALLRQLLGLLGAALLLVLGTAILGGNFLVRRALAPAEDIARRAERISLQNLKERLPVVPTRDELERLSVSLNHMIERLDQAWEHNRRFIADASHELRTPLTIMRGELELLVEQSGRTPEWQARAATVLEEVVRLTRIVEGLFNVARLDAGEARPDFRPFDLAELTTSTAEQMCLLAEDKRIRIECRAPQPVRVNGDRARLKQVVVNLLDNAIKYTPEGGRVALTVASEAGQAVLEVADTGIGIPATARARIFERFFRVDPARSRALGGAGLGLSIVKAICTAHGGQVDFQSEEGRGTRFLVRLPLAEGVA